MKYFFTFLFGLLFSPLLFLQAQGLFVKPMGSSYHDIEQFLARQKFDQSEFEQDQITVWAQNYQIQYHFRQGKLYRLEMLRDYDDRKDFRDGIASIRSHYEELEFDVMNLSTEKDKNAFVVRKGHELHEIYQVPLERNAYQIRQLRLDLDACSTDEKVAIERDRRFTRVLHS